MRQTFHKVQKELVSPNDIYPGQYHPRHESFQKFSHVKPILVSKYRYSNILHIDGTYQIRIPVPGIQRDNIYIEVTTDHIIIRIFDQQRIGEDKQAGKRRRVVREWFVHLPDDADANYATAKINNSVLTIELAKKDTHTKNFPGTLIAY